jgi:hypothetical protein
MSAFLSKRMNSAAVCMYVHDDKYIWRRRGTVAAPLRHRCGAKIFMNFLILIAVAMTDRSTRGVGKKKRHNLTELEINTLENEVSNLTKDAEFPCNTINIYSLEFI